MATITSITATDNLPIGAMNGPRLLHVTGSNFPAGMTVEVTPPGRPIVIVPAVQVRLVSSTVFILTYTLDAPGAWRVAAAGPAYTLTVLPAPVPTVTRILPIPMTAVPGRRTFSVEGTGFQPGCTATTATPSGPVLPVTLTGITANFFNATGEVDEPGGYTLTVNNQVGGVSAPFAFQVALPRPPVITSTSVLVANTFPQPLQVWGSSFVPPGTVNPTTATVVLTPPAGTPRRVTVPVVPGQAFLSASVQVPASGIWTLQVENVFGTPSNAVQVVVQPAPAPVIQTLAPGEPGAAAAAQRLAVRGTGFQLGMAATVTPDGGTPVNGVVSGVTFTQCQVEAVLASAGGYTIQVLPAGVAPSNAFAFQVQAPPVIATVSPASPLMNAAAQVLQVRGTGFRSGMTLDLTPPNRAPIRLPASAITSLTGTGFGVSVTLALPGQYQLRATNPGGVVGNPFLFTVLPTPRITGVTPVSLVTAAAARQLQVNGTDFVAGLTAALAGPDGQPVAGQVQGATSTTFTLAGVLLDKPGAYSLQVENPGGGRSNAWTVEVAGRSEITSIAPQTPRPSSASQSILVDGTGFDAAPAVVVTGPNGDVPATATLRRQDRLEMNVVLAALGSYTVQVDNATTGWSNAFPFTVA